MNKRFSDLENIVACLPCAPTKEEFTGTSNLKDPKVPVSLDFTGADLCQNTMFVGTVGSGKTTSMNTLLQQLINYRSLEPRHKLGLFIYDSKMDETRQKVTAWAKRAGREKDLVVLAPDGDTYYELFQGIDNLIQVEELATKLLACSKGSTGNSDAYWQESRRPIMLMGLVLAMCFNKLHFSTTIKALQSSIVEGNQIAEKWAHDELVKLRKDKVLSEVEDNLVNQVIATYRMWTNLSSNTKSCHSQIFANNLQPLLSPQASQYFLPKNNTGVARKPLDIKQVVSEGKIVVVSLNAVRYPELASLLGRLIKADFYDTVQARQLAFHDEGRLTGLILDEYPLVVTGNQGRYGDIQQLQSMRSKRAFVVAATQGFSSLDMVIGSEERDALTLNFNNWLVMKSNESNVRYFISQMLPSLKETRRFDWDLEEVLDESINPNNLAVNQAYVSMARQRNYAKPLWLRPTFFDGSIAEAIEVPAVAGNFHELVEAQRVRRNKERIDREAEEQKAKETTEAAATPESKDEETPKNKAEDKNNPTPKEPEVAEDENGDTDVEIEKVLGAYPPFEALVAYTKHRVATNFTTGFSDLACSEASDPFLSLPGPSKLSPKLKLHKPGKIADETKGSSPKTVRSPLPRGFIYFAPGSKPRILSVGLLREMINHKIITADTVLGHVACLKRKKAGSFSELSAHLQKSGAVKA